MAREDWYVDNWLVTEGWIRDVETRGGLYRAPAKRGDNLVVANRRGQLWTPKIVDQGGFTLSVWLGDASRALVEQWWDNLLRAVMPGHRLPQYRRTLAGGSARYCYGEVVSTLEPAPIGNLGMRATIEVAVPDGVWWDYAGLTTDASTPGQALPSRLPLATKANVTAPQDALTFTIAGPITNPLVIDVTDGVDGQWFTYDGAIASGQSLIVNCATFALSGTGGFTPDLGKFRYSGNGFLSVPAGAPGVTPTVELRGSLGGAATALTVAGVAAWLV